MNKPVNAFVLRQSPSGVSQLESISLPKNVIVNGWSLAGGLIGEKDYSRFREVLRKTCYSKEKSLRKAGYAASTMWHFLNEMNVGDWVVVPYWGGVFYLAEVIGAAFYDGSKSARDADSCYRRPVKWLNGKQPIPRKFARSKLISRMKTQQTSAEAGDLVDDIFEALRLAVKKSTRAQSPSADLFSDQLRVEMIETVLHQIKWSKRSENRAETSRQRCRYSRNLFGGQSRGIESRNSGKTP